MLSFLVGAGLDGDIATLFAMSHYSTSDGRSGQALEGSVGDATPEDIGRVNEVRTATYACNSLAALLDLGWISRRSRMRSRRSEVMD